MQQPIDYLHQALALAELRRGFCAPNPAVGAVAVKQNQILGTGYHWASGHPHAEVEALASPGEAARGATLYVTLEPCCHTNKKTPPCTDLLIARGIREVFYGLTDPNPQVAGKGEQVLRAAGIPCTQISSSAINDFYQSYIHWQQTGRPWVTAKLALSLDGKIAGPQGQRINITGSELQHYTHIARRRTDALLTTVRTILQDDPQLNVRLNEEIIKKPVYILDRELRLPSSARIWQTASAICLFHKPTADSQRLATLQQQGATCVAITETAQGLDLMEALTYIGQQGIHDLWVEAGGRCFEALSNAGLIQQGLLYIAPQILGENAYPAFNKSHNFLSKAQQVRWQQMGQDVMCELQWEN